MVKAPGRVQLPHDVLKAVLFSRHQRLLFAFLKEEGSAARASVARGRLELRAEVAEHRQLRGASSRRRGRTLKIVRPASL